MQSGTLRRSMNWGLGASLLLWAVTSLAADSPPGTDETTKKITDIAQNALAYAGVLAAAGTVSMAFVELVKGIFDVRRHFQQSMLSAWLGSVKTTVLPELLYLAIGDRYHENVLCGQPIEKMMGQLQAAARIALDYPEQFPHLYTFLTSTDFEEVAEKESIGRLAPKDRNAWKDHSSELHDVSAQLRGADMARPAITEPLAKSASDAAQARARLASLVGRKLDGFQLRTDFWWSRMNQALSIMVSIIIVFIAVSSSLHLKFFESLFFGTIGGLLAPFAKDFSQSLAKFTAK